MYNILDPCCGSRMFWFDKENPKVLFGDIRELEDTLCDGRKLEIKPDQIMDFRNLPFDKTKFKLIVFDPPHMNSLGKNSWMAKKYGVLGKTWRDDLRKGFSECFRVLEDDGILIFKWNESDIKVRKVLELVNYKPLFGHKSGKLMKTHWITFMKSSAFVQDANKLFPVLVRFFSMSRIQLQFHAHLLRVCFLARHHLI